MLLTSSHIKIQKT